MAEEKKVILTREGYEKLEKELDYYVSVRRNEISEQIAIARGFGDLSENAEYDEAKTVDATIEIAVQINGKMRSVISIPAKAEKDEAFAIAKADEKVIAALEGKTVVKEIYVPGKIVNIVVR